ncbi:CidA/LrgA family protein [Bengtsoniella intestinalis]|uniref:CidA/LrgA family protein n=1 Tax=Bengtsoniella intestinalis TaxID=3073143 RepID=UPI00391FA969
MNLLIQLALVCGICLGCEAVVAILPFAFPASVLALLVVFLLLLTKALKLEQIDTLSHFLLQHIPLLFIPVTSSIINYWSVISDIFVPFFAICLVTMVITYGATAFSVRLTIRWMTRREKK